MKGPKIKRGGLSDGVNGTILSPKSGRGICEVCRASFQVDGRRKRRFCSSDCRLLAWAVNALATALKQGKAEGLREQIGKLAGELQIKVVHTWNGELLS